MDGRPLTAFRSTRELVMAMRDVIRSHQRVWEDARILHQDITVEHLFISDIGEGHPVGFVHDPEDCGMFTNGESNMAPQDKISSYSELRDDLTTCTNAYLFRPIDRLRAVPTAEHYPRHDLESYYWVLLWVVSQYTECCRHIVGTPGAAVCAEMFNYDSAGIGFEEAHKFAWVMLKLWLDVANNIPLTTLIAKFSELVLRQTAALVFEESSRILLTHDNVLEIFDEALDMEGWPANDGARKLRVGDKEDILAPGR